MKRAGNMDHFVWTNIGILIRIHKTNSLILFTKKRFVKRCGKNVKRTKQTSTTTKIEDSNALGFL